MAKNWNTIFLSENHCSFVPTRYTDIRLDKTTDAHTISKIYTIDKRLITQLTEIVVFRSNAS